jgi:hypothetical protein
MYTTNGTNESSTLTIDPSLSTNHNNNNNLDDISQSLNDSDLYIPQMFAV